MYSSFMFIDTTTEPNTRRPIIVPVEMFGVHDKGFVASIRYEDGDLLQELD